MGWAIFVLDFQGSSGSGFLGFEFHEYGLLGFEILSPSSPLVHIVLLQVVEGH